MTRTFLVHPPPRWRSDIETLNNTKFFLVNRVGPTVFVLRTDGLSETTYKVCIGENQRCSCGGGEGKGQLCIHIMFVVLKVLLVPNTNPLSWQLGLVDNEVDQILTGNHLMRNNRSKESPRPRHPFLKKGEGKCRNKNHGKGPTTDAEESSSEGEKCVNRKDLTEDCTCSICQDDMLEEELHDNALCYCEMGCGSNFHHKCFRMYSTHARAEKNPILCPMFRIKRKFNNLIFQMPVQTNSSMPLIHRRECKILLRSIFFRCVSCSTLPAFDLCRRCFEGAATLSHDHYHPFVKSEASKYLPMWSAAISPASKRLQNLSDLQQRDFTDQDYNVLLSLDEASIPLHNILVTALPKAQVTAGKVMSCILCSSHLKTDMALRQLPCRAKHIVHDSCALSVLIEAESSGTPFGAAGACCPVCTDAVPFFPALKREPCKRSISKVARLEVVTEQLEQTELDEQVNKNEEGHFEGLIVGHNHSVQACRSRFDQNITAQKPGGGCLPNKACLPTDNHHDKMSLNIVMTGTSVGKSGKQKQQKENKTPCKMILTQNTATIWRSDKTYQTTRLPYSKNSCPKLTEKKKRPSKMDHVKERGCDLSKLVLRGQSN